jgi:hypothetical protein
MSRHPWPMLAMTGLGPEDEETVETDQTEIVEKDGTDGETKGRVS